MQKMLKSLATIFLDFLEITVVCTVIFGLIYFFLGQLLLVSGESMFPTLHNNEQLVADKASLKFNKLKRGEIVVFKHPDNQNRLLVKRVIAIAGDKLKIDNGDLYINGSYVPEPYLNEPHQTKGGKIIGQNNEITVPKSTYVLMGDNRNNSNDSRDFGYVWEGNIVGRAFMVYYPLDKIRIIEH